MISPLPGGNSNLMRRADGATYDGSPMIVFTTALRARWQADNSGGYSREQRTVGSLTPTLPARRRECSRLADIDKLARQVGYTSLTYGRNDLAKVRVKSSGSSLAWVSVSTLIAPGLQQCRDWSRPSSRRRLSASAGGTRDSLCLYARSRPLLRLSVSWLSK